MGAADVLFPQKRQTGRRGGRVAARWALSSAARRFAQDRHSLALILLVTGTHQHTLVINSARVKSIVDGAGRLNRLCPPTEMIAYSGCTAPTNSGKLL